MGLFFFCTWIIGGLGGGGKCKITWNVFQISSTLLTPFTTFYVRNLYLTPPTPPSPLSGKEQTRSFCDNQYSLASYFLYYLKKMFATIIFGHGS